MSTTFLICWDVISDFHNMEAGVNVEVFQSKWQTLKDELLRSGSQATSFTFFSYLHEVRSWNFEHER